MMLFWCVYCKHVVLFSICSGLSSVDFESLVVCLVHSLLYKNSSIRKKKNQEHAKKITRVDYIPSGKSKAGKLEDQRFFNQQ